MPATRTFCCAKNCYNYQPANNCPSFFHLPHDLDSRLKWAENAGRPDIKDKALLPSSTKYYLCADHFDSQCFVDPEKRSVLRRDIPVIPTNFESNLSSLIGTNNAKNSETNRVCTASSLEDASVVEIVSTSDLLDTVAVSDDVLDNTEWQNIVAIDLGEDGDSTSHDINIQPQLVSKSDVDLHSQNDNDALVVECLMLCRLCASLVQIDSLVPIFGEGTDEAIQNMIEQLMPGQVIVDDGLPQKVCTGCVERLRGCCEILDLFKAANCRLRQMIALCNFNDEDSQSVSIENQTFKVDLPTASQPVNNMVGLGEDITSSDYIIVQDSDFQMTSPTLNLENNSLKTGAVGESRQGNHSSKEELSLVRLRERGNICIVCAENFAGKANLLSHYISVHSKQLDNAEMTSGIPANSFQCSICDDIAPTDKSLHKHMITHLNENYACKACNMKFRYKAEVKIHVKKCHSQMYDKNQVSASVSKKCLECGKEFKSHVALRKHRATHSGERTVLCSLCGKTLANLNSLRVHMRCHSEERPYPCSQCEKSFKGPSELRSHTLTHTREKIYNCPDCGRKFHSKGLVRQHMLSHTRDKPHKCNKCTAAFNRLGNLNQHKKKHANELGAPKGIHFECTTCGKRFQSKLTLKYHVAKHTGDKYPFDCEICGKKLIALDPYRVHMRIHTGERPFECEVCKKSFRSMATLKQHTASLHRDDFPHACPFCQRSFKRLQSLVVHKKTHTGEKPWLCSICGRAFAQKGDMLKHTKTHRSQMEDEIIMEADSIDDLTLETAITKMIFG